MDTVVLILLVISIVFIYKYIFEAKFKPKKNVNKLAEERNIYAQKARNFYQQNDRRQARHFSRERNKLNEEIFDTLNPSSQSAQRIDLHRLYTNDAINKLETRINLVRSRRLPHLDVIVGRGNHSEDGPKLKPAVIEFIRDRNLAFQTINDGCLRLEFNDSPSWLWRFLNFWR